MGFKENDQEGGYEAIHRALLSGLLSHIGLRGQERDYRGARNSRFFVHPGSGLFKRQPKWVMAAELVETSKLYGRTLAEIEPRWIELAAGHLLKRSYAEPHWERGRGQVAGYEKVTLYGLVLVGRRKINFTPIDPRLAREIFIRSALVDGDFHTRAPFWRHNQELIADLRHREAKARRRDILVDEERIYAFYDARIPPTSPPPPTSSAGCARTPRRIPSGSIWTRPICCGSGPGSSTRPRTPTPWNSTACACPWSTASNPGRPATG
jgi:ATP-dependent helicase HrpA